MKSHRARRITGAVAVLLGALASITVAGPLAGVASAATAPTISYKYPGQVSGSGFTPGGQVRVQETEGTTVLASTTVTATKPSVYCYPFIGCFQATPGGNISATLPYPGIPQCNVAVYGTVSATDLTTGSVASTPAAWVTICN